LAISSNQVGQSGLNGPLKPQGPEYRQRPQPPRRPLYRLGAPGPQQAAHFTRKKGGPPMDGVKHLHAKVCRKLLKSIGGEFHLNKDFVL
jgi:hypothetical protein